MSINVSQNYSWENPVTRISAKIDSHWIHSVKMKDDGQQMYIFSDQGEHVITNISGEYLPTYTLPGYVELLKKSLVENFQFSENGHFFNKDGHQFWQFTGVITEGSSNFLKVQVIQIGTAFWRMVTIQAMPYDSSDRSVDQLQAALWSTVK